MNSIEKLKNHQSITPSKWKEKAEWIKANQSWIKKSQQIALTVLSVMDELDWSQKKLAEQLNVSPQYVNKLLKGVENLSLETIAKLEKELNIELITVNSYNYSQPVDMPIYCNFKWESLKSKVSIEKLLTSMENSYDSSPDPEQKLAA